MIIHYLHLASVAHPRIGTVFEDFLHIAVVVAAAVAFEQLVVAYVVVVAGFVGSLVVEGVGEAVHGVGRSLHIRSTLGLVVVAAGGFVVALR